MCLRCHGTVDDCDQDVHLEVALPVAAQLPQSRCHHLLVLVVRDSHEHLHLQQRLDEGQEVACLLDLVQVVCFPSDEVSLQGVEPLNVALAKQGEGGQGSRCWRC